MKIAEALDKLKPWQQRLAGAGIIVFAGFPLLMEYNYEYYNFKGFGLDTLKILLPLYFLALCVWWAGFWLIEKSLSSHYLLIGDAFGKGCLLLVNCWMVMNLFPAWQEDRPYPERAFFGAMILPLIGWAIHWAGGFVTFWPHLAARLRINKVLMVTGVLLAMGYVLSVVDYFMYEKALKEQLGWEQVDLYRFMMAEIAGLTMVAIMFAWVVKVERWTWGDWGEA